MRLYAVPRLRSNEFRVPLAGGKPCVVVNAAQEWDAVRRWRPSYLEKIVGDREVAVRETTGPPINIYQRAAEGGVIPFGEFLDWVLEVDADVSEKLDSHGDGQCDLGPAEIYQLVATLGFECSYYLDAGLGTLSATLLRDIRVPDWFSSGVRTITLWCGVFGTSCGLHCDLSPNCNVQVIGRKRFILFAPDQSPLLYPISGRTHCRFDPNLPDFDSFPSARRAIGWECTLEPGESLYIPVGWYHQTTIVSGWATNVNVFWRRPFPHGLATPGVWPHLLRRARALALARMGVVK
ncbi:cupin-like domain-containing protein [Nocardia sp. GCM10030253]|uniref:cupin-like domain-containing protein n=1 Tax=Nocardia sp. GCM10030253 TaxID=3273404 RepID=UPI003636CEAB